MSSCLYLPGVCLHNVPSNPGGEPIHLEVRDLTNTFIHHSIQHRPSHEEPLPEEHPLGAEDYSRTGLSGRSPNDVGLPGQKLEPAELPKPIPKQHTMHSDLPSPLAYSEKNGGGLALTEVAELINHDKAFENTSTSVAASQMRNALNMLADTVTDTEQKKVCAGN